MKSNQNFPFEYCLIESNSYNVWLLDFLISHDVKYHKLSHNFGVGLSFLCFYANVRINYLNFYGIRLGLCWKYRSSWRWETTEQHWALQPFMNMVYISSFIEVLPIFSQQSFVVSVYICCMSFVNFISKYFMLFLMLLYVNFLFSFSTDCC